MSSNFGENRTPVEGIKQPLLESQLNLEHPLVKLALALDWQYFEQEFRTATTTDVGRPALSSRLLVGLHYLKALYDDSVLNAFTNKNAMILPNFTVFMLQRSNVLPRARSIKNTNLVAK